MRVTQRELSYGFYLLRLSSALSLASYSHLQASAEKIHLLLPDIGYPPVTIPFCNSLNHSCIPNAPFSTVSLKIIYCVKLIVEEYVTVSHVSLCQSSCQYLQ